MMVTKDRIVSELIASRGMREASWNQIVKGNGLEAQGSLSVDFSDSLCELIVEALNLKSFTHRRNDKSRISPEISSPWLIN
jgi:hypothetical protein